MAGQELSLDGPVFPLGGCNSSLPFLEESSTEVPRPPDKLLPGEGFLDQVKAVEDNNRGATNIDGENVTILLGELLEGVGQVAHLENTNSSDSCCLVLTEPVLPRGRATTRRRRGRGALGGSWRVGWRL